MTRATTPLHAPRRARRDARQGTEQLAAPLDKGHAERVAATIRTVFAQPSGPKVREQLDDVARLLRAFPAVADRFLNGKADLTALADFPMAHRRKIRSTNPRERLNRQVKRRTDVVGIFPDTDGLLRLGACVPIGARHARRLSSAQPVQGAPFRPLWAPLGRRQVAGRSLPRQGFGVRRVRGRTGTRAAASCR